MRRPSAGGQGGAGTRHAWPALDPRRRAAGLHQGDFVSEVASYGKQLSRIEDAFAVLLTSLRGQLTLKEEEAEAIDAFQRMMAEIAAVKRRYRREKAAPGLARLIAG